MGKVEIVALLRDHPGGCGGWIGIHVSRVRAQAGEPMVGRERATAAGQSEGTAL